MTSLLRGGQSVSNLYLRFSGMEEEKDVLSKLSKRRFCNTSNEDVCLIPNTRVKNTKKKRVTTREPKVHQTKVFDNYQEVMVFQSNDSYLMKCLCDCIWNHNLDENHEIFMVFLPLLMERVAAAVRI